MQDRYVGDVGDYLKYSLLLELSKTRKKLGVAWYLHPDENLNADGKHTNYLSNPKIWRDFSPAVFDLLKCIIDRNCRKVSQIEELDLFSNTVFSSERLENQSDAHALRKTWRKAWFQRVLSRLNDCDVVFADPDNGLRPDRLYNYGTRKAWKSIPLAEVHALSKDRLGIFYHHNTRRRGGHLKEIQDWIEQLGADTCAIRWRAGTSRTFFVLNATDSEKANLKSFAKHWGEKCSFH